ncbi:MAG TPA: GH25 family lysozyme [Pyrinomonadaceae bacterium]
MIEGIDISHYQWHNGQPPNFSQVVQTKSYCIIKASDGAADHDATFKTNWALAKAQKTILGAYHFFRALHDPIAQAKNFINQLTEPFGAGQLPYMWDIEEDLANRHDPKSDRWKLIQQSERIQRIAAFDAEVKRQTGAKSMIYTRANFFDPYFGNGISGNFKVSDLPLVIVDYRKKKATNPEMSKAWLQAGKTWTFHQYSGSGKCPGIQTDCDLDRFNGSLDELKAFAGTA